MDQVTNSVYPATVALVNNGAGLKASPGTTYQYTVNNTVNPQAYCITATNATTSYSISSSSNIPTVGACPGQGVGGVAPITNLITNPSFETDLSGWGGSNTSLVTTWFHSGSQSLAITPPSPIVSDDTYVMFGSYNATSLALKPSTTYTLSAYGKVITPGAWGGGQGIRQVTAWVHDGSSYIASRGNQIANSAGAEGRSFVTFTTPPTITQSFVRLYWGYGDGKMLWDSVMLTEGSTLYNYADPITNPNWVWNGSPNSSTSTGPPL
jgi:hypothetical protein